MIKLKNLLIESEAPTSPINENFKSIDKFFNWFGPVKTWLLTILFAWIKLISFAFVGTWASLIVLGISIMIFAGYSAAILVSDKEISIRTIYKELKELFKDAISNPEKNANRGTTLVKKYRKIINSTPELNKYKSQIRRYEIELEKNIENKDKRAIRKTVEGLINYLQSRFDDISMNEAVNDVDTKGKWVSTKERWPAHKQPVVVKDDIGKEYKGYYDHGKGDWISDKGRRLVGVVKWKSVK